MDANRQGRAVLRQEVDDRMGLTARHLPIADSQVHTIKHNVFVPNQATDPS